MEYKLKTVFFSKIIFLGNSRYLSYLWEGIEFSNYVGLRVFRVPNCYLKQDKINKINKKLSLSRG